MPFDAWIAEVRRIVVTNGGAVSPDDLDPNAMYMAFSNGVSPQVFANAAQLPVKEGTSTPPPTRPAPQFDKLASLLDDPAWKGPKGSLDKPVGKVGLGTLIFCLFVLCIVLVSSMNSGASSTLDNSTTSYTPTPSATSPTVAVPTPPKPKALTDQQKVDRAKLALATWTGEDEAYGSSVSLLSQVPKTSKARREAVRLLGRWRDRKKRADAHKAEAARLAVVNATKKGREEAKYFTGDGDIQVAVYDVKIRRSTELHVANRNSTFVYVGIATKNTGADTVHVNPNDFTLADSNGNTASHESDSYSLGNHFDAVNLAPGQQTSGWLIFCMLKDKRYTLTRDAGFGGTSIQKAVIP